MKDNNHYINNDVFLKWVIISITMLSIVICALLYKPLNYLSDVFNNILINNNLGFLVFIGYGFQPITFTMAFGILRILFDKVIWKLFAKVGLLLDINGTWCGSIKTDPYPGKPKGKTLFMVMVVKQSFSKITIKCYFSEQKNANTYSSNSTGYSFHIRRTYERICVSYSYNNCNQKNKSPDKEHLGFNYFYYDNNILNGYYVTFRNSGKTGGKMFLKKANPKTEYSDSIWVEESFEGTD